MRTDATIDNKAIPCPNATFFAGGRGKAKAGDMITCNHSGATRMARILGRVSAPALSGDDGPTVGWALVMMLSNDGSFAYERWINPADITRVYDAPTNMAAFFFAPTLPYDAHTMRRLMEHGTTMERYITSADERVKGWNTAG